MWRKKGSKGSNVAETIKENKTVKAIIGEVLGTFMMCFFGIGAVATATLYGAHTGPFQVGMVWGITIAIAIYVTRNLSCAHFNPAVTFAMCVSKRLPWKEFPVYVISQLAGAIIAAALLWVFFADSVAAIVGFGNACSLNDILVYTAAPLIGGGLAAILFTQFIEKQHKAVPAKK